MMDLLASYRLPEDFLRKLRHSRALQQELMAGKPLHEIIGFSQEILQHFYAAAYRLYQTGKDSEAADAFFFLTALDPSVKVYWLGLGMAEQCLNRFEEALTAYAMASMIDVEDPLPYYHSGACYHAVRDLDNARKSLEMAIELFGPEHATLKSTAQTVLKHL